MDITALPDLMMGTMVMAGGNNYPVPVNVVVNANNQY